VLWETLERRIGVVFGPDFAALRRGSGGVNSGYACGGLVPMWERRVDGGLCGGLGVRAAPAARFGWAAPFGRLPIT
jgi:hypothetical protein